MNNDRFKFRAYNKNTGKMIDLNLITPLALSESRDGVFIPFSEESIVMQCTGLKADNDKLIYEGDFISYTSDKRVTKSTYELQGLIGWEDDRWIDVDHRNGLGFCYNILILGNQYENPELLENVNDK